MDLRQLGNSSVYVSPIIFGGWAIGGWMWGGTQEDDSIKAIQTAIDNGVNTIDTAAIYGMGYGEEVVAKAIKGRRDKVVIATKCGMRWDSQEGSEPWPQKDMQGKPVVIRKNCKPESIAYECEQSLKRLGIDVIDLYQIHFPDSSTPIEDSWYEMVKLKKQGKVRAIGVSNYNLSQLQEAHFIHPVDSIQPPYSLLRRDIERDILLFCRHNNIGVIVYSPLERGLLTGKVSVDRKFAEGDHRAMHRAFTQENRQHVLDALKNLQPIADKYKVTLAQLVIRTTIAIEGITSAIVGARNADQALENAKSATIPLTEDEINFIMATLTPDLLHETARK